MGLTVLRGGEIWWYITGLGIQGSSYVTSGMNHLASGKLQFFISEMNIRPVFPNSQEVLWGFIEIIYVKSFYNLNMLHECKLLTRIES